MYLRCRMAKEKYRSGEREVEGMSISMQTTICTSELELHRNQKKNRNKDYFPPAKTLQAAEIETLRSLLSLTMCVGVE